MQFLIFLLLAGIDILIHLAGFIDVRSIVERNLLFLKFDVFLSFLLVFSSGFTVFIKGFIFVLEIVLFGVDVLNFCLEVYEFVLEGAESIFKLPYFVALLAFLGCPLGDPVVIIVGILFLNAVKFDDHLLFAVIFDHNSFIFEHFLQFAVAG